MNALLLYMVKASVYLAGFYIVYFLFLSSDTLYSRNRIFLLSALLLSFMMPLFTIQVGEENTIYYFGKTLSEVYVTAERISSNGGSNQPLYPGLLDIIFRIYIIGAVAFGIKFLIDIISLAVLIISDRGNDDKILRFKGFNTAGFSAAGYIFINKSVSGDEAEAIISHEQSHLRHFHFFDILFLEIVKVVQWFNPFIYLINRSLRAVHEYQADAGCLREGMTVTRYQHLLLSHLLRSKIFLTSNSFSNPSLIRKRMIMMSKPPSRSAVSLKLLLAIPVVCITLIVLSAFEISRDNYYSTEANKTFYPTREITMDIQGPLVYHRPVRPKVEAGFADPPPPPPVSSENSKPKAPEVIKPAKRSENNLPETVPDEVFVVVEEMPQYPGGDKGLMEFIYANVQYPQAAKERGVQGRVILRFAVMADGSVDHIQVIRSIDPDLDQEASRVVGNLEKWTPGRQGGKPVNVWYSVPITFQLK